MDNRLIARYLLEMARGMEYLDESPFRVQAYRKAAQSILETPVPVSEMVEQGRLSGIPGVGKGIASTIEAWVRDRDFSAVEELNARLPRGLDELLKIPGLGFKRIRALHTQLSVETLDDLQEAIRQGKLSGMRAFPRKFVDSLPRSLERVMSYRGKLLISAGLSRAEAMILQLASRGVKARATGQCRRFAEVIERIDILVECSGEDREKILDSLGEPHAVIRNDTVTVPPSAGGPVMELHLVPRERLSLRLLLTTGSDAHILALRKLASEMGAEIGEDEITLRGRPVSVSAEEDIYRLLGLQYLPPEVREGRDSELARARTNAVPALLEIGDIRGTIHNHTDRSDGVSSLPAMVRGAMERGYRWIGISDHSKSAYYAGGLDEEAVALQHREISALGGKLPEITIFRGIESDILADGSLDYPPEILRRFDFVIASIHSHMEMSRQAMTKRIIKALRNPFTTILAHPTGRLLLAREPYEVDMDAVLEEALKNRVAVELNANPMRLDLDWRLMDSFVTQGGIIAIGPDAHSVDGLDDMTYGVMIARKGFVTPQACLNTRDARDVKEWFCKT
ncbi:MAG TPA: PHP domain-containing protein [Deltaproteobacteria bacterium]|nr:PHP domain-containing protein [Deltaproteobacteria bacterium]HQO79822.1 PHP domain-containing protein [Deltaproteobacteria bacterium]HRR21068.1 PHP domain-containing protein [Desulfomonilia bacterium]HRR68260.1 PHP domain-containing protein [Desulfomonilia bacterium]HRT44661.1 PHP domain-containing protein [Desulfomonilia bacterium]